MEFQEKVATGQDVTESSKPQSLKLLEGRWGVYIGLVVVNRMLGEAGGRCGDAILKNLRCDRCDRLVERDPRWRPIRFDRSLFGTTLKIMPIGFMQIAISNVNDCRKISKRQIENE